MSLGHALNQDDVDNIVLLTNYFQHSENRKVHKFLKHQMRFLRDEITLLNIKGQATSEKKLERNNFKRKRKFDMDLLIK